MAEIRDLTWLDYLTPKVRVEIDRIDVTDKLVFDDGLAVEWTLDFPSLTTFSISSIKFSLRNDTSEFDPGNLDENSNFFLINNLPHHGHNVQVNILMGFLHNNDEILVRTFTGVIDEVSVNLANTKAEFLVLDAGAAYRRNEVTDFGEGIFSQINDGEDNEDGLFVSFANQDYKSNKPYFKFPEGAFPISRDSLSATIPLLTEEASPQQQQSRGLMSPPQKGGRRNRRNSQEGRRGGKKGDTGSQSSARAGSNEDVFFWVVDTTDDRVYCYNADGSPNSSRNFDVSNLNGSPRGITYADDHFYITDTQDNKAYCYETDGDHVPSRDFDFNSANSNGNYITWVQNHFWVMDTSDDKVYCYELDGDHVPAFDFNLVSANGSPAGIYHDGNDFFILDSADDQFYAYTTEGVNLTTEGGNPDIIFETDLASGNGSPRGLASDNEDFFFVIDSADDKVYAYGFSSGGHESSGDFNLTSANSAGFGLVVTPTGIFIEPTYLDVFSGNGQSGIIGETLSSSLIVRVLDSNFNSSPGVTITFSVTGGGGSLSHSSVVTDQFGLAETFLTLGSSAGTNTVRASATLAGFLETVTFTATGEEERVASEVEIHSGNNQSGTVETELGNPLIVEVRDQNDDLFQGATVTFTVLSGGGSINRSSDTTDSSGQAETTLTLGSSAGGNSVRASVSGVGSVTFNATAMEAVPELTATTLESFSGNNQIATIGATLSSPFVARVLDQNGDNLSGVTVNFSITSGGGTLSASSNNTDSNGRAEVTLTLGSSAGTNTVRATVSGISGSITFNATAVAELEATTLSLVSGNNQRGLIGEELENPLEVIVRDQNSDPISDITVRFSVESGGGTLSRTIDTTDSNGLADTVLTLGDSVGTNTVEASVSGIAGVLTFTASGLTSVDLELNIVPSIRTEGDLSYENAEIDYERGILKFEYEPPDKHEQEINVKWRSVYKYKRIDTLVRLLLANSGFDFGFRNEFIASFPIKETFLKHPDNEQFSSHGRPLFRSQEAVVRWLMYNPKDIREDAGNSSNTIRTPAWFFVHGRELIYYDVRLDDYESMTSFPVLDGFQDVDDPVLTTETFIHPFTGQDITITISRPLTYWERNNRTRSLYVPYQFNTKDFDTFYVLATRDARGDASVTIPTTANEDRNRNPRNILGIYNRADDTWDLTELTLRSRDIYPHMTFPISTEAGRISVADNRKSFQIATINSVEWIYFIYADETSRVGVARYRHDTEVIEEIYSFEYDDDTTISVKHGLDFHIYGDTSANNISRDDRGSFTFPSDSNGNVYIFQCQGSYNLRPSLEQGALKLIRTDLGGSSQTEVYSESFTGGESKGIAGKRHDYFHPLTCTDILLNEADDLWYFTISYRGNVAQLCSLPRNGSSNTNNRLVIDEYDNIYNSPRSACYIPEKSNNDPARYFYILGNWLNTFPREEYPAESYQASEDAPTYKTGHLIEIDPSGTYSETSSGTLTIPERDVVVVIGEQEVNFYTTDGDFVEDRTFMLDTDNNNPIDAVIVYDVDVDSTSGVELIDILYVLDESDVKVYAYTLNGNYLENQDFFLDEENYSPIGISYNNGMFYVTNLSGLYDEEQGTETTYIYNANTKSLISSFNHIYDQSSPRGSTFPIENKFYSIDTARRIYVYDVSGSYGSTLSGNYDNSINFFLNYRNGNPVSITHIDGHFWILNDDASTPFIYVYEDSDNFAFQLDRSFLIPTSTSNAPKAISSYTLPLETGDTEEVQNNILDHGLVWKSEEPPEVPEDDPENLEEKYRGWGVHNSIPSNMIADDRDNLHFIAGFGLPIAIKRITDENIGEGSLPVYPNPEEPVNKETNFIWVQWGLDLSSKLASFPTNRSNTWELLQDLAALTNSELGFDNLDDFQNYINQIHIQEDLQLNTGVTVEDIEARTNLFFRRRSVRTSKLKDGISSNFEFIYDISSITDTTIRDNHKIKLVATSERDSISEFPEPDSSSRHFFMINGEIFSYNAVDRETDGDKLSGMRRAILGTESETHVVGDTVYFIDAFALNDGDIHEGSRLINNLVLVNQRSIDFPEIYNSIDVSYGESIVTDKDDSNEGSIEQHGERKFSIENKFLSQHDRPWAEFLADSYLNLLKDPKEIVDLTIKFSPQIKLGQLILLHQTERIFAKYKKLRVLRVSHNISSWQTDILGREI